MSAKAKIITVKYKYVRYILKIKGCDKDVSIQRGKDKDIKI